MGQSASKRHEKRVTRCLQSFAQLQHDIRHINLNCAAEFAMMRTAGGAVAAAPDDASADAELMVIHFRPFTKLTRKASLPWLWKLNDNVIVTATITPKREADAMIAAAAAAAAAAESGVVAVNPPAAAAGADVAASGTSSAAAPAAAAPSSSSAAPAAAAASSGVAALPAAHPSFTLTIREFYNLFLYYCDNVSQAATLRDQVLKLENPSAWQAKQDARRKECMAQLQQQSTPGQGAGADADEQKEEKSAASVSAAAAAELQAAASSSSPPPCQPSLSRTGSAAQDCSVAECCICLNVPGENGLGQELVVLSCLHSCCSDCLEQWRQQSATCPLCRRELDEQPEEDDSSWILTSHDLAQLRSQHQKLLDHPFALVQARPTFPPKDNRKGVKNAGDAFSLVVGEVLDVLTPPVRRPQRQVAAAEPGSEVLVPVAVPVHQPAPTSNDVQIPVAMPVAKTQTDPEPQL